ncbi:hypothetical protein ACFE04_000190 [Oxalis oulophora]
MAVTEEPILSRLDRLDTMLKELDEIRGCNYYNKSGRSSGSGVSTPPTTSSGTVTSEGLASSIDFSPKSLEKHCRPINHVLMLTEVKGTLVERLDHVEDRVHKLEEELEVKSSEKKKKKGLKQLMKKCVHMKS